MPELMKKANAFTEKHLSHTKPVIRNLPGIINIIKGLFYQAAFGNPSGNIQESGVSGFKPQTVRAWSHLGDGSLSSQAGLNSLQIEARFSYILQ